MMMPRGSQLQAVKEAHENNKKVTIKYPKDSPDSL